MNVSDVNVPVMEGPSLLVRRIGKMISIASRRFCTSKPGARRWQSANARMTLGSMRLQGARSSTVTGCGEISGFAFAGSKSPLRLGACLFRGR
jgi:hypothetical protein